MIERICVSWERRRLDGVSVVPHPSPARRRRSQGILFLLLIVLALGSGRTLADSLASGFDAANKLYEQAKYADAASSYEELLHSGQASEALYFNWGNALFKSGQIGRAIAAYQQALGLAPRDPDARANLQFARNQVQGPTLLPDRLARWLGKLSLNEWTCLAVGGLWLSLLLLAISQWRRELKAAVQSYMVWLGLATACLCGCFALAFYSGQIVRQVIVIAPETVARQAPLDESQSAFTLHDGAELQVLDQKDEWLQVKANPHNVGWVRKADVLVLRGA